MTTKAEYELGIATREKRIRELEADNARLIDNAIEELKKMTPLSIQYHALTGGEAVWASPAWGVLATMIVREFDKYGNPENFLETPFEFELRGVRSPRFTITIRKQHGKSPSELLAEAKAELASLKGEAAREKGGEA